MKRFLSSVSIISVFLILHTSITYAQQNPSGIKWKSIDTGTYVIIFPEEIEPLGQRVANLMEHYEKYNYSSIKAKPRRIPIVLINNYTEPNGFVSFAPFYSHWFTTPSSFDSIEWFKGLAIHEGRHMVQQNKLKDGPGQTIWRILLGDYGTLLLSVLYVPAWFFEGDSVVMETALTHGGRGRSPYFDLLQRGLELSGRRETYLESYLGSYDSLSPYADHYRLGYILCSYIRTHNSKNVFDRVLSRTGRYFFWYTFGGALKRETGKSIDTTYTAALDEYRKLWEKQREGIKLTGAEFINPAEDNENEYDLQFNLGAFSHFSFKIDAAEWENYLYPYTGEDGVTTAVFFTKNDKLSLIKLSNNKKTETISQLPFQAATSFLMNERNFTAGGNYALWRENIPDPRWGYRSYSDLRLLDIRNGSTRYITHKKKYISSAISPDGKTAAGIEYGTDLRYFLSIIDIETGNEILRDEIKDKGYLFDPAVSPDGKDIAITALSDSGYSLLLYSIETKKITTLIGYTHDEKLRSPVFYDNYIIYGSDFSGIDNIYAIDIKSGRRFQVTSRPLGAYFPSISGDNLLFNDYTVYGYKAAAMKISRSGWVPLEKVERKQLNYIETVAEQELSGDDGSIDNIPETVYETDNYYPILHIINPFAWVWVPALFSSSTDFYASLISSDVFNTTDIILSYIHNFNENKDSGTATIAYRGLYPIINLTGSYGGRAVYLPEESEETSENTFLTWNETTGFGSITIPLNFSRGIHGTYLNFGSGTGYIKISDMNRNDHLIYEDIDHDGELHFMNYFLSFSHNMETALNSVSRGTGESLNISYYNTPYEGDYRGSLFSADLSLYLPGFSDLHGTKISGSYEKTGYDDTYVFPQKVLFARGYDAERHEYFYKGSIDYSFPLADFSLNVWKLVYFKRIKGDIFYDHVVGITDNEKYYYRSAGFELTAEQNWFSNKYLALELGIRYSRLLDVYMGENDDKNRIEIVIYAPFIQ